MTIRTLLGGALLAGVAVPALAAAPPVPPLASVSVTPPVSTQTFPGGKEAAVVSSNCLTCHSAGMVMTQPNLPKAAWEAEVRKMINTYKAPIAEQDVAPIVAYLVQIKGMN